MGMSSFPEGMNSVEISGCVLLYIYVLSNPHATSHCFLYTLKYTLKITVTSKPAAGLFSTGAVVAVLQ